MSLTASVIGSMILANASSGITPSIVMSRTSDGVTTPSMWVAPCHVTFDATGTTDAATTDLFGDLHYSWDFGDYSKSNEYWIYGANSHTLSKNRDLEPLAAHVYETPGTYYVTLTVTNSLGKVNAIRQQIIVTDPDVVFSGTNTICFSGVGNFAEAKPGSQHVTSSDLAAIINTYAATGKRLMLMAGESFTAATIPLIEDKNNGQITRYGTGANPQLYPTAGAVINTIRFWEHWATVDNWQIFGLDFTNPNNLTGTVAIAATLQGHSVNTINSVTGRILCHKTNCTNIGGYFLNGYGNCVSESSLFNMPSNGGLLGIWGQNTNMCAYIGNNIDNDNMGEHCLRIQGGKSYVAAHNRLARPWAAKHCLTLRGSAVAQTAATWTASTAKNLGDLLKPVTPNGYVYIVSDVVSGTQHSTGTTEPVYPTVIGQTVTNGTLTLRCEYVDTLPYYYISNNICIHDNEFNLVGITGQVDQMTAVHPQGTSNYEVIENITWRRNFYNRNDSVGVTPHSLVFFQVQGSKIRFQNNIINMQASFANNIIGVNILGTNTANIPVPHDIIIENNSFYTGWASIDANHNVVGAYFTSAAGTGMIVKNNLLYAPLAKGQKMVIDATLTAVISNNTTDAQILTPNPFVASAPSVASDFKLAVGSYGKGSGIALENAYQDYYLTTRSRLQVPDMGAIDHRS